MPTSYSAVVEVMVNASWTRVLRRTHYVRPQREEVAAGPGSTENLHRRTP